MTNPIPTVGVVCLFQGKVLLVKHSQHAGHLADTYGLPAGRVEVDPETMELKETTKAAAAREFREETGYVVSEKDLVEFENNHFEADVPRSDGTVKKMTWTVFLAKVFTGEMKASEETTPEWVSLGDINNLPLVVNVENAIRAAMRSQ